MVGHAIRIGCVVRDSTLGLVWKVVDRDDDGTIYIERDGVRSFTTVSNLELIAAEACGSVDPDS